MKEINQEEKVRNGGLFGTAEVIIASVIFIILGLALLFVPQIQLITICYGICCIMVAAGIICIVKYFLTEAYRNMDEYGFSKGVLLVILGMCALVRAQQVAASFILCLGVFILLSGIIKLQYSMAVKIMKDKLWIVLLFASFFIVGCAITIILDPFSSKITQQTFTYYILIIDGVLSIICNIYLYYYLKNYGKREMEEKEKEKEELKQQLLNENVRTEADEEEHTAQSASIELDSTEAASEDKE